MSGFAINQIVGTPDSGFWSQVHHFSGLEKKKLSLRGEMVLLLSIKGSPQEAATALGREIISRIHEEYYGSLDGLPMDKLKKSLEKIGKEKPVYLSKSVDLFLATLVLWKGYVYLAVWGEGKVLLSRKGEIGQLIKGEKGLVKAVSGKPQESDLYCLATDSFFSQLPSGTIMASLATGKPDSVVEILSPLVHARQDQAAIGAALVSIKEFGKNEGDPELMTKEEATFFVKKRRRKLINASIVFHKAKSVLQSVFGFFLKKRRKRDDVFVVSRKRQGKRRMTLTLAIGFLLLLLISIFFGWQKKQQMEKETEFINLYSQAEKKLAAAESIKSLNPQESLTLLDQFFSLASQATSLGVDSAKISDLESRANKLKGLLGGGEKVSPELFFNLNLIADEAVGTRIFVDQEKVYVLDASSKNVFSITWPEKRTSILASASFLSEMKEIYLSGKTTYLLSENGVFELESEDKEEKILEADWQSSIGFNLWGGNLYLLDREEQSFWKYPKTSNGFGDRVSWFSQEPAFNWQEIVDFDIDGEVWFLSDRGKIYRYFAGSKEDYPQTSPAVSQAKYLSVSVDGETLSFWDESEKTIYLLSKSGELLAKIPLEIEKVNDFSISPDGSTIFILVPGEVYWIDLERYTSSF